MNSSYKTLKAVLYQEEHEGKLFWYAHCLENNHIGHGTTQMKALRSLVETILCLASTAIELNDIRLLTNNPAPQEIVRMYEQAGDDKGEETAICIRFEEKIEHYCSVREYVASEQESEVEELAAAS